MLTVSPPHADVYVEQVVYQHPLLFLKIWEISAPGSAAHGEPSGPWPWHYHKEVEFLAILEGRLGVQTEHETRQLGPGDVAMLGSSQLHRTFHAAPGAIRYLVFQVDLPQYFDQSTLPYASSFAELTEPLSRLNYIFDENETVRREVHALILDIYAESQTRSPGYEFAIGADIRQLLLRLIRSDSRRLLAGADSANLIRLRPALDYIERHLSEPISIKLLCEQLHLSYHYFIKLFRKSVGLTFVEYVNYKRIKTAERLLLTRDLSVSEVGELVGIPNMSQFYKLFKRQNGCTPKAFLQRMRLRGADEPAGDADAGQPGLEK